MQIRLYLDEDSIGRGFVRALRTASVDVLTAREAGMLGRSDEEHLAYAAEQQRVICTFNVRDFHRLHGEYLRAEKHHAGILLSSSSVTP